jgi:hypothetical protein
VNTLLVEEPAGGRQEPMPRSLFRLRGMFCGSDPLCPGGCSLAHLVQCTGLVCLSRKCCDAAIWPEQARERQKPGRGPAALCPAATHRIHVLVECAVRVGDSTSRSQGRLA